MSLEPVEDQRSERLPRLPTFLAVVRAGAQCPDVSGLRDFRLLPVFDPCLGLDVPQLVQRTVGRVTEAKRGRHKMQRRNHETDPHGARERGSP